MLKITMPIISSLLLIGFLEGFDFLWERTQANSQRGPEIPYEKPPGTYRILNLGDSVAMGWGVRLEDTYGQRLESLLNKERNGDLRYEVINAGVPGWNVENELAYLQAEGPKYEPDLILLDLTLANDVKGKSALLADNQPAPIKWLRSNTYFWPFLTDQLRWLEARAFINFPGPHLVNVYLSMPYQWFCGLTLIELAKQLKARRRGLSPV